MRHAVYTRTQHLGLRRFVLLPTAVAVAVTRLAAAPPRGNAA